MANRIQTVVFRNNGTNTVDVTYDVLDQGGAPTPLGKTLTFSITAAQATAFIAAVQTKVDTRVATDLTAAQAQMTNTLPT